MKIAIIGTGNVGAGLTRSLARTSHDILVAGSSPEAGPALAEALRAEENLSVQGTDVAQAVAAADLVILAVPFGAIAEVAGAADFNGKIVVDPTNPLLEDYSGLSIGHSTSAAEETQRLLPNAKVVKAFNTVFAQVYPDGANFGDRRAPVFVAADDADAKATVSALAADVGFDTVDTGGLRSARHLEPLGYLNIQLGYMLGHGTQIAPAWLSR